MIDRNGEDVYFVYDEKGSFVVKGEVHLLDMDREKTDFALTLRAITNKHISRFHGRQIFEHFWGNVLRAYEYYIGLIRDYPGEIITGGRVLKQIYAEK